MIRNNHAFTNIKVTFFLLNDTNLTESTFVFQ